MSASPFNSLAETCNRLIICLSVLHDPKSIDELVEIDLKATYAASFGLGSNNLHGMSPYAHLEFSTRRQRVSSALRELVKFGFVRTDDFGITYYATENANTFCQSITDDYIEEYRTTIRVIQGTLIKNPAILYLDRNGNIHE